MEKKTREHYEKEFKENAVKLSEERKNVSDLARELGISPMLLYRWRKEYKGRGELSFPGNGKKAMSEEEKEIAALKKKLYDTETERDILKKAMSILSRSDRRHTDL